jgi:methionyl aminopeptidase
VIALRTEPEIDTLRRANAIVADILAELADAVAPGVTTGELDDLAERRIREKGGTPAFLGYRDYPRSTCISLDEVVVHGIPGKRKLKRGQIVSIDVGVKLDGYHGDAALSVPCGKVDKTRQRLLQATDRALASAIRAARSGSYLEDISRAVQAEAEGAGFSVVRVFVGHGIGTKLHEEPQIPNFATGKPGPRLRPGMVLAIEPMVNAGTCDVRVLDDGWTAVTADGKPSAHFEHSIVIREDQAEILSFTPKRTWGRDS